METGLGQRARNPLHARAEAIQSDHARRSCGIEDVSGPRDRAGGDPEAALVIGEEIGEIGSDVRILK